jgi:hypothetical protein
MHFKCIILQTIYKQNGPPSCAAFGVYVVDTLSPSGITSQSHALPRNVICQFCQPVNTQVKIAG